MSKKQFSSYVGANYRLDEAAVSQLDGVLRATDYDDVYFDANDGLAESQHVFIRGSELIEKLHSLNSMHIS